MAIKGWKQFTTFYFYTAVALCLCAASAAGKGPSWDGILALLVSGSLSWGLIEYGLHRFIFHFDARSDLGRKLVYTAHLSHHEQPTAAENLFASLRLSVPIAACYWLLAWGVTGTWRAASYLFTGLVIGYFCYEWLHFQAHHGRSRLRLFRYLKKYHLLHHHRTPNLRFGVTSPLFDLAFGTFKPVGRYRLRGNARD
jgi:sterol desaturase/sphingolipid hydroxylase (fatty acid hydroxylase superfamily)